MYGIPILLNVYVVNQLSIGRPSKDTFKRPGVIAIACINASSGYKYYAESEGAKSVMAYTGSC